MNTRNDQFLRRLDQGVVILDGAMGTSTHALDLPLSDFNGLENCPEILNITRPDAIEQIHASFLEVGCDAVETNTFGGSKIVLAEFDLAERTYEINAQAAQVARLAVKRFATPEWPRFVIGSIGPGTRLVTLRQTDYDTMLTSYYEQIRGLLDGGVDVLLIETCQDILQTKCAIQAARKAFDKTGRQTPLMCQVTMETTGTMLVGTDIAAAVTAIEAFPEVDVIGLNCATGPQEMSEHVRYLSRNCGRKLSVLPNAGLPQLVNGQPYFPLTPAELARWLREFVEVDGVNIVGGCCGTTPEHLRAVVAALRPKASDEYRLASSEFNTGSSAADGTSTGYSLLATGNSHALVVPGPRAPIHEPAACSLYQAQPYRQDNSFLIVGERCNTNGSRQFKRLLAEGDLDGLVEMGIEQVKEGAHVLDVCVDYVGRDGVPDMHNVVDRFAREITIPLMLDSTEVPVVEAGLRLTGGKCIVNSVNLEDGEVKMEKVCALARQYGAALVALTIDEDPIEAMAKTAERKLAVALRIHDLLTRKYGINEEDIFFDCLTFPITTGNEADRRLALETLDGIERVMQALPRCQSILGVSNVSFGLAPAARVVLNSVFLHEARQRGLTAAIVHASKILPRNKISDERWNAALDLVYDRHTNGNPLEHYIGLFAENEDLGEKVKIADLPIEERLKQRIIDGQRPGIDKDLDAAMEKYRPLEIINTFLLDGMKVVGELFGSGQMQLPFVLKSAETMKAAVAHLEPHMEKTEGVSRGKIVLATVRGDVHDIGKNLVDIILTNNGYTVYNLGIKQPIGNIITAFREHAADAIGLSGLLVKSTLVMRDDLQVLNEQNISAPVILGGAALTRNYVEQDLRAIYKGDLHYAKDAFEGLHLMAEIGSRVAQLSSTARSNLSRERERVSAGSHVTGQDAAPARMSAGGPVATSASGRGPMPPVVTKEGKPGDAPAAEAARRSAAQLEAEIEQRYGLKEVDDDLDAAINAVPPLIAAGPAAAHKPRTPAGLVRSELGHGHAVPAPPFWGDRVLEEIPTKAALGYLNEVMLFQVQWGFRKKGRSKEEFKKYIDTQVRPTYRELVARCEREQILRPQAIYGYWPCNSEGNDLIVYAPPSPQPQRAGGASSFGGSSSLPLARHETARFTFPRQKKHPYWCLADFWRPVNTAGADGANVPDVVAFSIVTAGRQVSDVARQWFASNEYQQYLFLHGLGVELAEALAEYIHKQVRAELGIAEKDAREITRLFQQGYQGSRFSFGYPACPRLEDQTQLFKLLRPERIGVTLSEEFQMEPEQSTSAIIAYHPEARYFNVR